MLIGRTDAEAELQTLATWCEELTNLKRPQCWERLKTGGEGDDRGWDGWMASLNQWTWVWVTLGVGDGQGGLVCCSSWGHKESDISEWLNWTEVAWNVPLVSLIFLKRSLDFPILLFSSISLHWSLRRTFLSLRCSLKLCLQMGISFLFSFFLFLSYN